MGKKKDDNENKNYKVPPIIDKKPVLGRKKVPLAAARKPVAKKLGVIADRKKNPKVTETKQENLINGEKPGTSAAAALADTE